MDLEFCDNYHKQFTKIESLTKELNKYIVAERQKKLYFEEKGYFPEEFDWPDWAQGTERTKYVKKLTETNETSTAKRPSRGKIKPPEVRKPWSPPKL